MMMMMIIVIRLVMRTNESMDGGRIFRTRERERGRERPANLCGQFSVISPKVGVVSTFLHVIASTII